MRSSRSDTERREGALLQPQVEHEVFVEPGARSIEAKLAGYEDAQQRIEASKGGELSVMLTLGASAVGLAAGPTVTATATPRGEVPPVLPTKTKDEPRAGVKKAIVVAGGVAAGMALGAGVAAATREFP
jgi:hypothetical protein